MNDFPGNQNGPGSGSEDEGIRRLFNDAVSDVEPHDSLDAIRERTVVTPFRAKRPWILGAAAAVVATAATVTAVAVTGGNPGTTGADETGFAGGESPSAKESARVVESERPTPTRSPSPSPSPSNEPSKKPSPSKTPAQPSPTQTQDAPPPPRTVAQTLPVYYVGETSRGPRLFREFHQAKVTTGSDDDVTAALTEALAGQPLDGDYRTDWPGGTSGSGSSDAAGVLTVDLTNADANLRTRTSGMTAQEASMAVEQLIYTAQAASQTRVAVQFTVDGQRADQVLGVPASEPLAQGAELDVLAGVWVIDPAEGSTVDAPFTVSGLAVAFEANVQWELMQGDRVVRRGFTTAQECCTMAPYSFKVNAPPGEYTLVVHDTDASGGEGFAPWQDTKNITVR